MEIWTQTHTGEDRMQWEDEGREQHDATKAKEKRFPVNYQKVGERPGTKFSFTPLRNNPPFPAGILSSDF